MVSNLRVLLKTLCLTAILLTRAFRNLLFILQNDFSWWPTQDRCACDSKQSMHSTSCSQSCKLFKTLTCMAHPGKVKNRTNGLLPIKLILVSVGETWANLTGHSITLLNTWLSSKHCQFCSKWLMPISSCHPPIEETFNFKFEAAPMPKLAMVEVQMCSMGNHTAAFGTGSVTITRWSTNWNKSCEHVRSAGAYSYENHVLTVCKLYSVVSHLHISNIFTWYTVCLIAAATTPWQSTEAGLSTTV